MAQKADSPVLVVGGGIIGLASAWWLARRGIPCRILDHEPITDGASFGNAGLIVYGHPPLTRPGVSMQGLKWMFDPDSPLYIRPRLDGDLARWGSLPEPLPRGRVAEGSAAPPSSLPVP